MAEQRTWRQEHTHNDEQIEDDAIEFGNKQAKHKISKKFYIELPRYHYVGGEIIAGNVVFKCDKPKNIRNISLKFKGLEHVRWTERHGDNRTTYEATRILANHKQYYVGSKGGKKIQLDTNVYTYPFSLQLPIDALPTLHKVTGQITWMLSAGIKVPWSLKRYYPIEIYVHKPIPIIPISACIYENSNKDKTIIARVNVDRTTYFIGETVNLVMTIDNFGNEQLSKLVVKLKQKEEFHASGKTRSWTVAIAKTSIDKLLLPQAPTQNSGNINAQLVIPPKISCVTLDPQESLIIHITHYLSCTLIIQHSPFNKKLKVHVRPVTLLESNILTRSASKMQLDTQSIVY